MPVSGPRFVEARKTPGLQAHNSAGVTKAAQLQLPFSLQVPHWSCNLLSHLYDRAWGGPAGGGPRLVRPVPASSICPLPPTPPADSQGATASYQGPPVRHQHTSLLAAPSSQSRPLSLAPNWLREVGRKGGVGVPQGTGGTAKGPPHLMPRDTYLEGDKQGGKALERSSTTPPTLWLSRRRPREGIGLVQGHTASWRWRLGRSPSFPVLGCSVPCTLNK